MIVCWSAKGGSGTSVTAALIARSLAQHGSATLVDLQGDQDAIFACPEEAKLGVNHWLAAGTGVLPQALGRLAVPVADGLSLLPAGTAPVNPGSAVGSPAARIAAAAPDAIVDVGAIRSGSGLGASLVTEAQTSLLVIRPCYLALRRATALNLEVDAVLVIEEPGRSLDSKDVAEVLGGRVLTVAFDPALARAVDAGRLARYKGKAAKSIDNIVKELRLAEVSNAA